MILHSAPWSSGYYHVQCLVLTGTIVLMSSGWYILETRDAALSLLRWEQMASDLVEGRPRPTKYQVTSDEEEL